MLSMKLIEDQPIGVAITPDGTRAYVTNQASDPGTVSVIDTANNEVIDTITVGNSPAGVAIGTVCQ